MPQNQFLPVPDFRSTISPSPEQIAEYERLVLEQQAKDPLWKKLGRGAIDLVTGATKGMLGMEPPPGLIQNNPEVAGNVFTQLLQAGLPFLSITKGKPVFHGSQKVFDKFDPSLNDGSDVLGWMTHFAENPKYAAAYASGDAKHGEIRKTRPNVIAAHPQAQNTLDLVDPNPDDISAALAAVPDWHRRSLIDVFKDTRRQVREGGDKYRYLPNRHYKEYPEDAKLPVQSVAEKLRMGPEDFNRSLFDAIRYRDVGNVSWAIPEQTPIRTAWGLPMTEDPKPLQTYRLPDDAQLASVLERPDPIARKFGAAPKVKELEYLTDEDYFPTVGKQAAKLTPEEWDLANKLKKVWVDDLPIPDYFGTKITIEDLNKLHNADALSSIEYSDLVDKIQSPIHPKPKPGGQYVIDKDNPQLPTIFGKTVNGETLNALFDEGLLSEEDFLLLSEKFFQKKPSLGEHLGLSKEDEIIESLTAGFNKAASNATPWEKEFFSKPHYGNHYFVDKDNPQLPVVAGKSVNAKGLKDLYYEGHLSSEDYKLLKDKYFTLDQAKHDAKNLWDAIKNKASLGPLTEEAAEKIVVFDTTKKEGFEVAFDDLIDALDYIDGNKDKALDWHTVKSYLKDNPY